MNNIAHFVMQSKGGVGKSVVSSLLAQYLKSLNEDLILIDTDPSNKTFASYKSLNVQAIQILNEHKLIDQSKFDSFINDFIDSDKPMLVDTGSGDFLAINGYLIQNEIPTIFTQMGKKLVIHVPLNFNQAKEETMKCLIGLLMNHQNTTFVIWENEYFGANTDNLKSAPIMKKYPNIMGVVKIREMNVDTERKDFSNMLEKSLTFDEVATSENKELFGFIQKSRIKRIQQEIWEQLDVLFDQLHANESNDK